MSYLSFGHLPWQEEETVMPTVSIRTLYCDHMLQYTECIQTAWTTFRNEFSKNKKVISVYVRKHLFLEAEPPRSPYFNPLHINVTKAFSCLTNHAQPPRDILKFATLHDQTCLCVHWFRCRAFWEFGDKNTTVITLGTCTVIQTSIMPLVSKVLRS
jgi:hypothetical protein